MAVDDVIETAKYGRVLGVAVISRDAHTLCFLVQVLDPVAGVVPFIADEGHANFPFIEVDVVLVGRHSLGRCFLVVQV